MSDTDTLSRKSEPLPVKGAFTSQDLVSDQDIRWCPGCGDYSILKQVQKVLPEFGLQKENIVFVSGIGCSSRFPYYMATYGMHSIHGRAASIATGLKMTRPELSVWVISGDGDSLSIGGNHFIHTLRKNPDINLILFNNQIYGLTKGQFSPTSPLGKVTKSSPMGSVEHPFNPAALALGADATFVARSLDRDPLHQQEMIRRAHHHQGTSLLEVYQNCNVFNDGAFFTFTERATKSDTALMVEHGKPLIFGSENNKGIRIDECGRPTIVDLKTGAFSESDLWVHDETDLFKASLLARFFGDPTAEGGLPRPFGVLYAVKRTCLETMVHDQLAKAKERSGPGDLDQLLHGDATWQIR